MFCIPRKDRLIRWNNAAITFDKCRQLYIKTVAYLPRYALIKSQPVSVVIQSWCQSSSSVCFPPFGRTSLLQIQVNPYRFRTGYIWAYCCRCHTGKNIQIPYRIYKGIVLQIPYRQPYRSHTGFIKARFALIALTCPLNSCMGPVRACLLGYSSRRFKHHNTAIAIGIAIAATTTCRFNTMGPRQIGCHIPDNIFQVHFLE